MKGKLKRHIRNTVRAPQNVFKEIFPNQEESLDNTRFGLVQHTTIVWNTDFGDYCRKMTNLSASYTLNLFTTDMNTV